MDRSPFKMLLAKIAFKQFWFQRAHGQLLEKSVISILTDINKGFPNDKWMELFSGVYKICTKPMDAQPGKLYFKLKEVLENYVEDVCQGLLAYEACNLHCSLDVLTRYKESFENYSVSMRYGAELFRYLDRHWIKRNHCETGESPQDGVYKIYEMSLVVWKNIVYKTMKRKLCSHMSRVMKEVRENNGAVFDSNGILKGIVATYEVLGMEYSERSKFFQREIEDDIVASTHWYFRRRGTALLATHPVRTYLCIAEQLLEDESNRCNSCFSHLTTRRILIAAQMSLIGLHSDRLIEESRRMLEVGVEQREDLKRLYHLMSYLDDDDAPGISSGIGIGTMQPKPVPGNPKYNFTGPGAGLQNGAAAIVGGGPLVLTDNQSLVALRDVVQEHICACGLQAIKDAQLGETLRDSDVAQDPDDANVLNESIRGGANSERVVSAMLNVYKNYRAFIAESFFDAPPFVSALHDACKSFVNAMPGAPEWLARHAHFLLDKTCKESKIDESERLEALDRVGFLFSYVSDKDVFHKYYSKLLSKRIIQLTSVNDEAEERMLENMRKTCGFEYTSKLQRMFVDKHLSSSLHTGYLDWLEARLQRIQASAAQNGAAANTMFTFTNDDEEASRMLEEMTMSTGGTPLGKVPRSAADGLPCASPPQSPMYFSPKGVSPRANMLPSLAWGKTLLKSMRRHTASAGSQRSGSTQCDTLPLRPLKEESDGGEREGRGGFKVGFEAFTFVLTAGCWPLQSISSKFTPPAPIKNYVKSFLEYYNDVHSHRKLEWLYHLGHGEMVSRCYDWPYWIYSSTFQMGILYQFNTHCFISVADIARVVNISEAELSRHLFPLIKSGLLKLANLDTEEAASTFTCDDLKPEHVVAINEKFSSKRTRIKVKIVDHSRQPTARAVQQELITDRMISVQAAVCRIMKARREMSHQELCAEVRAQLSHLFCPDTSLIKKSIEVLLLKEFISRHETEEAYKYCA